MTETAKIVVRADDDGTKYRLKLEDHVVMIDKWVGGDRSGEWSRAGQGYWSGNHIIHCTANLSSYDYLVLEDELKTALEKQKDQPAS